MKNSIIFIFFILLSISNYGQSKLKIEDNSFQVDNLQDEKFVEFTKQKLLNSQFVFIGEQHGIKEAGIFTNAIYTLAQPFNYKKLCIETDDIAAQIIKDIAKANDPISNAKNTFNEFPYAIPFYNNIDDYSLFKNVIDHKGDIWGIDQTFMVQFRMNFDYIINTTSSKKLKRKLTTLKLIAVKSFNNSIAAKDFNVNYIFKYDKAIHNELLNLSTNEAEREIFNQLWKTKEIYAYNNITKEYYKNNNVRGQLMKRNFMRYYKNALKQENTPKVIFKLGANHAMRGLTRTNIFDISNFGSELAISNDLVSVNYLVMGISGEVTIGNPFAPKPIVPFNNTKQLPKEIQDLISTVSKKYYILDLVPLRDKASRIGYTEKFKKYIFGYDVIVLVKNAQALKGF